MTPEKFVEDGVHRAVAAAGEDGTTTSEIDELVNADLRAAIEAGSVIAPDLKHFVRSTRENMEKRGRRERTETLAHAQSCLRDETILGLDDPTLDTEAVVGQGRRKAWRWVTIEDGDAMIETKRKHVRAAEDAYHNDADAWADVKAEMRQRGVRFFGDLWQ